MSFITFVQISLSIFTGLFGVMTLLRYVERRRKAIPGPHGYPFIGLLTTIGNFNVIHKTLTNIGQKYGRYFQFELLGKRIVVLRSVSVVETTLENSRTTDRKETFFQKYVFNGSGFAFSNYKNYVPELRQIFHQTVYWRSDVSRDEVIHEQAEQLVKIFLAKNGNVFDPDTAVKAFMTNIFSLELIGETLPEDHPDSNALWELIDLLYTLLDPSIDAPLRALPFLRFLPGKYGNIFRNTIKARDRVAKRYFDSQKTTYKEGQVRGLVDLCLKIQQDETREKGQSWLTDDYIKGLMYDTVAAGMSEMMKSVRMLILLMCHYPEVQSRVYAEIIDVVGKDGSPSSQYRNQMPYTEAVLMEMLRYVSQTPLAIPHKCNKDVVLDGYLIKKDSGIFPNIWGIHHDESIWTDPWVFRPERFLAEDGTLLPKDHRLRRSLIPFSVGKRRCPGEDFAMSRLFLLFTSMVQRLKFCPPATEELPSADPRLYTNKYPLHLPKYTCRAVPR